MQPTTSSPHDLPVGFADNHTLRLDYLRWRIGWGDEDSRAILEKEERDGFSTLLFDPEDDMLYDAGLEHYKEFICSLSTAVQLLNEQTTTFKGEPGIVEVVTRYTNGAQMRWRAL